MKRANILLSLVGFCLLGGLELGSATKNDNDSGPSVELTRQAVALGMEPSALGELWRNKQPVIISKPDAVGQLTTTTYELSPDGQRIISHSVNEEQRIGGNLEETTTSTVSPPAAVQPTNPQTDWEYLPNSWSNRRTHTLSNNWPNFGIDTTFSQWPTVHSGPDWSNFFPAGVTPQTQSKTEVDDQGRTVTTTTKTYRGPATGITNNWSIGTDFVSNWPRFEFPAGVKPQTETKTELDDQGRTVTTRTQTYSSPATNNWSPGPPDAWQPRPNVFAGQLPRWLSSETLTPAQPVPTPLPLPTRPTVQPLSPPLPTPAEDFGLNIRTTTALPSLDEFLRQNTPKLDASPPTYLYNNELPTQTESRTRVTSYSGNFNGAEPPRTSDLNPNVQELLSRGGITDEDIVNARAQGGEVTRTRVMPDGRVIKTTVRVNSFTPAAPASGTPSSLAPGSASGLAPGLVPGSTYASLPIPSPSPASGSAPGLPPASSYAPLPIPSPSPASGSAPGLPPASSYPPLPTPTPDSSLGLTPASAQGTTQPQDPSIENFLSQVNLSPADILAKNGEVVKTIVDKDGRVLSAKFVLSTVKGDEQGQGQERGETELPTK